MIKGLSILLTTMVLTGCSVDFSDTLPDYTGSDAAYIRVENTLQPTPYRIENRSLPGTVGSQKSVWNNIESCHCWY